LLQFPDEGLCPSRAVLRDVASNPQSGRPSPPVQE
jgi:hypothetical protein